MTVNTDPRYQALARGAAAKLGGGANLTRAILAQWQCELGAGDAYPPRRNNPGNLARGFATGLGYPFSIETPNPQPGNPIVTFRSPEAGAGAYAAGLANFARYAAARTAAHRDDGAGFLRAVTAAGWGTSASCALSVYGGTPSSSGPTAVLASAGNIGACVANVTAAIGHPVTAGTTLSAADWTAIVPKLYNGLSGDPARSIVDKYAGHTVQWWCDNGGSVGLDPLGAIGGAGDALAGIPDALAALPAAAGQVAGTLLLNGAILGVIVGLGFLGLRAIVLAPTKVGQ